MLTWLKIPVEFLKEHGKLMLNIICVHAKLLQSCPTLCDPVDSSPPGSSVLGFLQARIVEWGSIPSSKGSSWPRNWTQVSYVSCIGRQVLHHLCYLEIAEIIIWIMITVMYLLRANYMPATIVSALYVLIRWFLTTIEPSVILLL